MKSKTRFLTYAAIIAALYVTLTYLSAELGLASGVIQLRLSEALCILPYFTPAAVPALAIGCMISNLITGSLMLDVIFGSAATLIGAILTYATRRWKYTAPVWPILSNTLIVPLILKYVYAAEGTIPFFMLTVCIGEVITCGVLGTLLMIVIEKRKNILKF